VITIGGYSAENINNFPGVWREIVFPAVVSRWKSVSLPNQSLSWHKFVQ